MSMLTQNNIIAKKEIKKTLKLCNFCTRIVGFSFIDDLPKSLYVKIWKYICFLGTVIIIVLKEAGQMNYAITELLTSTSVADFVAGLHIFGYDFISLSKLLTIWYKRHIFRNLLSELCDLWFLTSYDRNAIEFKKMKLSKLEIVQFWYAFWNVLGVWLYNLTPVVIYLYQKIRREPASLGYIWHLQYFFDKTQPGYHELAFVFETFSGLFSVWAMLGSDILFMTMASHISMLLRLLQDKVRRLDMRGNQNCYNDITSLIKIHQRLIRYGEDLEDAFCLVNLINVLMSSVNICCVAFNILLDPVMVMSNKFYLGAVLTQVGILCWYADDISASSSGLATAVYESGWYHCDIRSRKLLLAIIQRSQKPLYFTAMKFGPITMSTYSSILATSYSYFALLYTTYRNNNRDS